MNDEKVFRPLSGKVALITGGSRGIGAAITRKLASWGCSVCINYVDRKGPAQTLAEELSAAGTVASIHCADMSQPDDISRLIKEVGVLHKDLHIVVQNAGATKFARLADATIDQWQFVQDTNSRSTWLLAKEALPLMQGRPGARYIPITNSAPVRIVQKAGLFAVAKAGMEALTKYLSYEFAPHGVVVNCVRPGLVQTGVFKVRPDFNEGIKHELSISPWANGEITTPENSADVVALLCLDEAAWIAGQIITVDGGFSLWATVKRGGGRAG